MFRNIDENDLEMIKADIEADPTHSAQPGFVPEIFTEPKTKNVAFCDDKGEVLFWANFALETRVKIQFRPGAEATKVREAMTTYLPMFAESFRAAGARALLFDSVSKPLIWFMKRLGFKKATDEYRKEI